MSEQKELVDHPDHYNSHPSGVEAIVIVENMSFGLGNAFKYVYRHKYKNGIEDLKKAIWYLKREIDNPIYDHRDPDYRYFGVYDAFLEILKHEEDDTVRQALDYIYYYSYTNKNSRELQKAMDLINKLIENYLLNTK